MEASLPQIISSIVALTTLVTGVSVYWIRKSNENLKKETEAKDRTENQNRKDLSSLINSVTKSLDELKVSMSEQGDRNRQDYKGLALHIDEKIQHIYDRLGANSAELKEHISKEVVQLKAKDYDQDIKLEHSKDRIHATNEALLNFKLEVAERYEKKNQDRG
jgi:hypothetical protein